MITIARLYDDYDAAARAVDDLERSGIPASDISIIASNADGWYDKDKPSVTTKRLDRDLDNVDDRREAADAGAAIGGTIGGVAGLLAGLGLLTIPGLGPVVAAGWLVSTAALGIGAGVVGGIIGALTQSGMSEDEASLYAEGVRRGGAMVTARVQEADAARVESILDRTAVDIRARAAMWHRSGWTRFDPAAPAYTADEIRRERELYRSRV
ncbi:MAG: hypothetical protein ACM3JG_01495 [Thiohalocapsa sp.]